MLQLAGDLSLTDESVLHTLAPLALLLQLLQCHLAAQVLITCHPHLPHASLAVQTRQRVTLTTLRVVTHCRHHHVVTVILVRYARLARQAAQALADLLVLNARQRALDTRNKGRSQRRPHIPAVLSQLAVHVLAVRRAEHLALDQQVRQSNLVAGSAPKCARLGESLAVQQAHLQRHHAEQKVPVGGTGLMR